MGHSRWRIRWGLGLLLVSGTLFGGAAGCPVSPDGSDAGAPDGGGVDAGSGDAGAPDGGGVDAGQPDDAGSPPGPEIGSCDPLPPGCPPGAFQVDLVDADQLAAAARGEGAYASDPPETCYFIHDGTYTHASNVLLWVRVGGTPTAPRRFVGQSRDGVILQARATLEADHLRLENLTFDLSGFGRSGAYNTVSIQGATGVTLSHLTLTGDCQNGYRGGHVEVSEASQRVVVACSLIERFGQCTGDGHLDHGVYLASGSEITIRDNTIRENASRGIQLNTQSGAFGTLDRVVIERNRIHANGHRNYEDGIVINGADTGTVSAVTIRRNLIYDNYYSGIRFSGSAQSGLEVSFNTFHQNGAAASGGSPSAVNLDDVGSGGQTLIERNLFALAGPLLNACYDAEGRGFSIADNVVRGSAGGAGACVSGVVTADVVFTDAPGGDFRTSTPEAAGYGAYAP